MKLKLFLVAIAAMLFCQLQAQDALKISQQGYSYPVQPGSKEWTAFQSHAEMLAGCTVPETELARLSPTELLATVFDYPLLYDYLAHNDLAKGLSQVIKNGNALTAFVNNKEAVRELARRYQESDPTAMDSKWDEAQKGTYSLQFVTAELFLVHPSVQKWLSEEDKKLLLNKFDQNRKAMSSIGEPYSLLNQNALAYASFQMMPELFEMLDLSVKKVYENGFSIAPLNHIEPILTQLNVIISQQK